MISKILLENSDGVLSEDGSFIILAEDTRVDAAEAELLLSLPTPQPSVGVTVLVSAETIVSAIGPAEVHLGITISPDTSVLTPGIQQPSLKYGVKFPVDEARALVSAESARARLVVGCWEIPFKITTSWDGIAKPETTFETIARPTTNYSTIARPNTEWERSGDMGADLLLEDGFILLLEDGGNVKIAENIWTNMEKPNCE